MTRYLTTPILALGTTAIKASIDYESAFASVRKTVDATEQEFSALSGSIKEMSTHVASSANDIAEVVAIAGQLGIENKSLMGFARTMLDLGLNRAGWKQSLPTPRLTWQPRPIRFKTRREPPKLTRTGFQSPQR